MRYPATLTPDRNGTIIAQAVDVPRALTAGREEADATVQAADALITLFVHLMAEDQPIPRPSCPKRRQPVAVLPPQVTAKLAIYEAMRAAGLTQAGLESLRDDQNNYSVMIANHFAEGVSNFTGSPSYKSVANILGVVKSVITRIGRNPDILKASAHSADEVAPSRCEPTYPERITVAWLKEHVPVGIWLTGLALLASAFIAGVQASKLTLVKELFGL